MSGEDQDRDADATVTSDGYVAGYRCGYHDGARDAAMLWQDVRSALLSRDDLDDLSVEPAAADRAPVLAFAAERMEQARVGLLMLLALAVVLMATPRRAVTL